MRPGPRVRLRDLVRLIVAAGRRVEPHALRLAGRVGRLAVQLEILRMGDEEMDVEEGWR